MKRTSERDFEEAIEAYLLEHAGYTKSDNSQFNAALGIDPDTLLEFLKATQAQTMEKLAAIYGADQVDDALIKRITSECDERGLLDVIRHGVRDRGQQIRLAYFRPPTSLNPETEALYQQNRLTVMRQVYYDTQSRKSIDMLLSLNGLPIATVELKNAFTGQRTIHAIKQYLQDRVPSKHTPLIQFKKRALVHFAVDTDEASMATKLAGKSTFFLPFNRGKAGGRGNPAEHDYVTGYKTGYLWEEVWQRDSWLDIIHRFINLETEERRDYATGKVRKSEKLIFPRYHQLTATRKLLAATLAEGCGGNYLIQHSAGSGKTNTISWTAHQLASLHGADDKPIYNTIVVVSDRRNLDAQLQDNIYQIDHKRGLVVKIDEKKSSADLAKELNAGTKIIITTLQKFSHLIGQVKVLSDRNFAVIVDEAHSSQSGRSAGNLRGVLGGALGNQELNSEEELAAAEEAAKDEYMPPPTLDELIEAEAQSRGQQPNVSFYAFTATPKHKTLEMFGVTGPDGKPRPFHLYSMRQAIEERFIHDVLKYYTTYKTYFELSKAITDDPDVDEKKAKKAIARFMSLHPHNLAQKVEIIVEHFREHTQSKINGRAKAMVVTRSRLHVVRYKKAFDAYIKKKGYTDIKALYAFSGTVIDPEEADKPYTEASMNGISEAELPQAFSTPEYQLLIVANKYQTGFDQPLLHTMFVDKRLADLQAVQTLSRLNRTTSGKKETFVLDFANEVEEIQEAFKPYYEQTAIDIPTEPNQLYTLHRKVWQEPVLRQLEVDEFAQVFFKPQGKQSTRDHGMFVKWVNPAVERFEKEYTALSNPTDISEEGELFKSNLQTFVRLYAFLSQIIVWQDAELEKLYAYGRLLLTKLPYRAGGGRMVIDDEVELTAYRNEVTFEGSASLVIGETKPVYGPSAVGTGQARDEKISPLSAVIEMMNARHALEDGEWTADDLLFMVQVSSDMAGNEKHASQVRVNTKEQVRPVLVPEIMKTIIQRKDRNEKIANIFMSDPETRELLIDFILDRVYERVNAA